MKHTLITVLMILLAFSLVAGQTNAQEAREELNRGATQYREGNYAEAQRHFEQAFALDPTIKNASALIARAIMQQYKPGVEGPENVAKAREAVAAYERILANAPDNEEAFNAVVYLYRHLKEEEMERQLWWRRATNPAAPADKRALAYIILASKQWDCSYNFTEANKKTIRQRNKVTIRYVRPESQAELDRARSCVAEGLSLAEQAANLDPDNAHAWSQKANLLRELSKLSEMEGDAGQKAYFDQQFEAALETHNRLTEEEQKKKAAKDNSTAGLNDSSSQNSAQPTAPKGVIVSGGVLNGKVTSKPMPAYPPAAKEEGAQGTVIVQIVVDEDGNVISAVAVSGHPLLRQAAVNAARQARFLPTRLQGQPVKVSGVITYNFALQ